jgi:membrane-bound lytic murein transglycosylase D
MNQQRIATTLFSGLLLIVVSVLAAWSVGREPGSVEPAPMDELIAESEAAGFQVATTWDLTKTHNQHVDTWINFLSGRNAERTRLWLERTGRYGPMIQEELARRGMPQDLLYLAMIESGFSPRAYSVAAASGVWQFIAETGRRYGLEVNADVDERRDPVKSTYAALDYLEFLHRRFDSWYLAAAAYNTGENRVGRIMRERYGREKGTDAEFWAIASRLPSETRNYVPLMLAAAHIAKAPEQYGFAGLEYQPTLAFDEVWVPGAVDIELIASAAGVPADSVNELNLHLMRQRTPEGRTWLVRLPAGTQARFAAEFPGLYRDAQLALAREAERAPAVGATAAATPARAVTHTVRRGETLSHVAVRYGVSVAALRNANGNVQPTRVRAGQALRIPGGAQVAAASNAPARVEPRYHQVRRGENLTVIARRYGTTIARLQSLNDLGRNSRIIAGQRLRVG